MRRHLRIRLSVASQWVRRSWVSFSSAAGHPESAANKSSPIGSMHFDQRRSLAKKRGYIEEGKIAAQKLLFGFRSELGSGSHSGHPVGCADYNKRRSGALTNQ